MSSESTISSILRTIIMMAFLAAIPLVAICGPSLPQMFMQLLENRFPVLAKSSATVDPKAATPAPQFEPLSSESLAMPRNFSTEGQRPLCVSRSDATAPGGAVLPTAYEAPTAAEASELAGQSRTGASSRGAIASTLDPFAATPAGAAETERLAPIDEATDLRELGRRETANTAVSGDTAVAIGGKSDQFAQFQQHLREMGATYFLLESWGSKQQLYRFYCKMAVDGNPNCTRPFEATNADPLIAMTLVLEQVEMWRSGKL